ncbi:unnamed protein product [Peronospora belbahrii]|uniref:LYC1 C-terminal domain-containing protein n=1 Tax=Peronospora belbahrii TaxID=622444 RepID=A0ABN8CVA3_9STRA|nr:unnamed protein product [Peronospora belbahrii]
MSKHRVVQLTQEALKVQCKVDDFEEWGSPALDMEQYQRGEYIQRATSFSQPRSCFDCIVRLRSGKIQTRLFPSHWVSIYSARIPQTRTRSIFFLKEVAKQLGELLTSTISVLYSGYWTDLLRQTGMEVKKFHKQEAFVVLPTHDSIEWRFCDGEHFARVRGYEELPSQCGVKIKNGHVFMLWCHNFKESTLYVVRARLPERVRGCCQDHAHAAGIKALEEARKFRLQRVAIWNPSLSFNTPTYVATLRLSLLTVKTRCQVPWYSITRAYVNSEPSLPHWHYNEKYAWV